MPPVAKRRVEDYEEGSPRWQLQAALDDRFGNAEEFFKLVADAATIKQQSASSTYYGFLKGSRPLPKPQWAVYMRELGVSRELLLEVDGLRSIDTPKRRDRLKELETKLVESEEAQAKLTRQIRLLRTRVGKLEAARVSSDRLAEEEAADAVALGRQAAQQSGREGNAPPRTANE